jgi:hypothetical protein
MNLKFKQILPHLAGKGMLSLPALAAVLLIGCSSSRNRTAADGSTGASTQVSADASTEAEDATVTTTQSETSNDETRKVQPIKGVAPESKIVGISDTVKEIMRRRNWRPQAIIYKTSDNYFYNLPVQVKADGTLLSFPAPQDVCVDPEPIELTDGWLISPIGVTANSVFTTYLLGDYRELTTVPTVAEIQKAIIPGAKVTMTMELPMTPSEALNDTAAVNTYIRSQRLTIAR